MLLAPADNSKHVDPSSSKDHNPHLSAIRLVVISVQSKGQEFTGGEMIRFLV